MIAHGIWKASDPRAPMRGGATPGRHPLLWAWWLTYLAANAVFFVSMGRVRPPAATTSSAATIGPGTTSPTETATLRQAGRSCCWSPPPDSRPRWSPASPAFRTNTNALGAASRARVTATRCRPPPTRPSLPATRPPRTRRRVTRLGLTRPWARSHRPARGIHLSPGREAPTRDETPARTSPLANSPPSGRPRSRTSIRRRAKEW
jgi:hypothetical protein